MSLHPTTAFLCSCAAVIAFSVASAAAQPSFGLTREVYPGIAGNLVSDLTGHASFPNSPTTEEVLTNNADCPVNVLDTYGQRLRGLITPPTTGAYTFWISSDDNSQLFLSTDTNAANKQLVARVNSNTSYKQWTKETNQQSAPVSLVAGQQYYFEALHKEGTGGDHLSVRWQLPSGVWEVPTDTNAPIPAARFIPVGVVLPAYTQQPTNVTVVEGNQTTFSVRITHSFSATFQWQRFGTNLSGATSSNLVLNPVTLADNGGVYRCVAVNFAGVTNSADALLTVVPDTAPPTIVAVGNLGDSDVLTVVFSEPVEAATAATVGNYTISGGALVLSATLGVDARTVVLVTTPLAPNVSYTLTVNNVRDRALVPNTRWCRT